MFGAPKTFEIEESERKNFEKVLRTYKEFLVLDTKDAWFDNVKKMAGELGYATDNADFKKNPEKYLGNVAKVCEYIRVAITGRKNSPDLYEIMTILGEKEVLRRICAIV